MILCKLWVFYDTTIQKEAIFNCIHIIAWKKCSCAIEKKLSMGLSISKEFCTLCLYIYNFLTNPRHSASPILGWRQVNVLDNSIKKYVWHIFCWGTCKLPRNAWYNHDNVCVTDVAQVATVIVCTDDDSTILWCVELNYIYIYSHYGGFTNWCYTNVFVAQVWMSFGGIITCVLYPLNEM